MDLYHAQEVSLNGYQTMATIMDIFSLATRFLIEIIGPHNWRTEEHPKERRSGLTTWIALQRWDPVDSAKVIV